MAEIQQKQDDQHEQDQAHQLYKIRVDKQHLEMEGPITTGAAILTKAGKIPIDRFRLDQKLPGGKTKKIELTTKVNLAEPGTEQFMTLPLDQTEGDS